MKRLFLFFFFICVSAAVFSQRMGVGAFAGGMHHGFYVYDYDFSPHEGYKAGIQKGGGILFFRYNEGRKNDENLRFNSLGITFYAQETDSIHVQGISTAIYPDTIYNGVQKTNYNFIAFSHTNYFKAKWNEFAYLLLGFQLGAVINNSRYVVNGYDPAYYHLAPTLHSELPKRVIGVFLGLNTGIAYEFEKFFVHVDLSYEWNRFAFDYYSLGDRLAASIGINVPLTKMN